MKLIVGLGNPGQHYETTRHNVGFMVVERLCQQHHLSWKFDRELNARRATLEGSVHLIEPQTMMNDSGRAVRASSQRWSPQPHEILIVCDDVNLSLGTLRLRAQGSDGGHHGLASCLEHLSTDDVPRLRIGVGGVEPLPKDLTEFVLSPFRQEERPTLHEALERAVEACEVWMSDGMQAAMNTINPLPRKGEGCRE